MEIFSTPHRAQQNSQVDRDARKIVPAIEHEPTDVPLADVYKDGYLDLYPQVKGKDFFRIYSRQDRLIFQAGSYIGLIPINDRIALDVRSRVPVKNIERILSIAEHVPISLSPHFREYSSHSQPAPSLIDLLAQSFIDALADIVLNGLYREYFRQTDSTSFPKGRILLGKTIRAHAARGVKHRVAASWYEQSVDTAPNRCLKYVIWYLAQRYKQMKPRKGLRRIAFQLNQAYQIFNRVTLDQTKTFLSDPLVCEPHRIPALRAYYRPALNLALTIIRNRGVSFDTVGDEFSIASLLIDFDKAFEGYLRTVLRSKLQSIAPHVDVLDGNESGAQGGQKLLFDQRPSEPAKPDIVCRTFVNDAAKYPLIIEVKYKKTKLPDRDDINQIIGYAVSYRSSTVVIVHPRIPGGRSGLHILGRIHPLTIYHYVFDLAVENAEEEEKKFVFHMRSLLMKPAC